MLCAVPDSILITMRSDAEQVARIAPVPVMLVRHSHPAGSDILSCFQATAVMPVLRCLPRARFGVRVGAGDEASS